MRIGQAGTLESNDALFTVCDGQGRDIHIQSIVMDYFGQQIRQCIDSVLDSLEVNNVQVTCIDKGALDCTLRARLTTAVQRYKQACTKEQE